MWLYLYQFISLSLHNFIPCENFGNGEYEHLRGNIEWVTDSKCCHQSVENALISPEPADQRSVANQSTQTNNDLRGIQCIDVTVFVTGEHFIDFHSRPWIFVMSKVYRYRQPLVLEATPLSSAVHTWSLGLSYSYLPQDLIVFSHIQDALRCCTKKPSFVLLSMTQLC